MAKEIPEPKELLAQLKSLSAGSKAVAVLVLVALALVAGGSAWVAQRPHFVQLYGGLDASESARVQKALSDASIAFEASQPPGPFSVYVDSSDRHQAFAAVASAGALAGKSGGIPTGESGMSTVFLSAKEREQVVRKREWEETEQLLEGLDFVADARVRTSVGEALGWGRPAPISASVTLSLRGRNLLDSEQSLAVASLVRNALGVAPEQLMITDQFGTTLYDGAAQTGEAAQSAQWLAHKSRYDRDLSERAERILRSILGPDKARVVVSSDWRFQQMSSISETADPEARVPVSEQMSESATPAGSSSPVGGAAGTAANLAGESFGVDQAAVADESTKSAPAAGSNATAHTSEQSREYYVPKSTVATVDRAPRLERLSVSLFLDESLAERQKELEESVKAAVGFDTARKDVFSATRLPFGGSAPAATGAGAADASNPNADPSAAPVEEPASEPNAWVRLLLDRGVEIAAACAFLFVLLRTLRGAKKPKEPKDAKRAPKSEAAAKDAGKGAAANAGGSSPEIDPETGAPVREVSPQELARAQVERMVSEQPERVGKILSEWARKERAGSASGR